MDGYFLAKDDFPDIGFVDGHLGHHRRGGGNGHQARSGNGDLAGHGKFRQP